MLVLKKNNTTEKYNVDKIKTAVRLSAERALVTFSDEQLDELCDKINKRLQVLGYASEYSIIPVSTMHNIVESTLGYYNETVAKTYRDFRNYKSNFVATMSKIYQKSNAIRYIGEDLSNANTDSAMISTQRSLIYGFMSKEMYQKQFLNPLELQAMDDGYLYAHDMKDRLDGINCCLFDMASVLSGGFEMGNIWYNEPNSIDTAFDVVSDITLSAASQQYGGFTIPEIDKLLAPYAKKSYHSYKKEIVELLSECDIPISNIQYWNSIHHIASTEAMKKVRRDISQGFQGWEYKFNTVASSRGDYPFIAISFGVGTRSFERLISEICLDVRKEGQGKPGHKKPVLFPKLTFLYDENLHGEGKSSEYLFDKAIECSSKCMYPDFLSLTGEGYIPSIYKKYGKVISLMGCRASLSPWFERGGMNPSYDGDTPVYVGRFNLGAISLHLPMILAKSRTENKDFYEVLDYYLEMIRNLHKKTYEYLSKKKASTNPLGFTQGGFLGGTLNPDDTIASLLPAMTMSFGITALNELQELYNQKSIVEDGNFALEVMKHINSKVEQFKTEDKILYAIYATPAESLCGLQIEQFRKKYGTIENVSSREYVSNSFHCGVWEDITPARKQDLEERFWPYFNGGKITYSRYKVSYNTEAIKNLVRRAMKKGFYYGINMELSYCEECGYEELDMDECPHCKSKHITKISRMNGYLGYTRVHGKTRYNKAKMSEISERVSM